MSFEEKLYALAGERLRRAEPMSRHTTFRIGGPAEFYVAPSDAEELCRIAGLCRSEAVPFYVIGNGSNLLCSDRGVSGVILDTTQGLTSCRIEGKELWAGAGMLLGCLAKKALEAGLSGLEFAAGIPGSVGGAMVMNAGAYGSEMKQIVRRVRVLTKEGTVEEIEAPQMDFAYRHSAVRREGWIVLEVCFALVKGEPEAIRGRMEELAGKRRQSQPLECPSAGSTFKRPAVGYAAQLIDEAGLKGFQVGGAQVSRKHAGFVVNCGGATAADVRRLCAAIQERVQERTGIWLEPEIEAIGEQECLFPRT